MPWRNVDISIKCHTEKPSEVNQADIVAVMQLTKERLEDLGLAKVSVHIDSKENV